LVGEISMKKVGGGNRPQKHQRVCVWRDLPLPQTDGSGDRETGVWIEKKAVLVVK